jgi:UDP-N-acetylglucosamine 2-epimerase (non-hydrolysing)
MPRPDLHLAVGSGTHAEQTGRIMLGLEGILAERGPELVVVAGDVNSTMAAAIVAAKAGIPVAHIEAGLRSFDWTMPEEINRVVTDRLAEILLTPSQDADENLLKEGVQSARIVRVGNVMIDSLRLARPLADRSGIHAALAVERGRYALTTLHRPANVDDPAMLGRLLRALGQVSRQLPVIFPLHPRTRARIAASPELAGLLVEDAHLRVSEPIGYVDFLALMAHARLVLTDSGGIQEETTALGVPCLTLRENTERPITVTEGTNTLVGRDPERIGHAVADALSGESKRGRIPALWDGHAAERIVDAFQAWRARRVA